MIEAALAHVVPNKAEAAYTRSDLFERRRLMDDLGRLSRDMKVPASSWNR